MKSYSREEGNGIVYYFVFVYNRHEINLILKKEDCFHKYILVFDQCIANFRGLRCFITAVMIGVLIKEGWFKH